MEENWRQRKRQERQVPGTDKGNKGKGSGGTKSVCGTENTVNCWKCGKPVHNARDCRSFTTVGEGEIGEYDWNWNAQQRDEQQPELQTGSTVGALWLCPLGGQPNASNPHLSTVTLVAGSGADVTVISLDTASDFPREHGPKKTM